MWKRIAAVQPFMSFSRCTVVLFNPKKNRQSHLLNSSRKTITCLAFSVDGRYLVTGECGHLPSVRVWDLQESGGTQIAEFPGHKYGISCVVSMQLASESVQSVTQK
jgi:WD40 repeat protein